MRGARPSFIYRLSIRLAQQALPFAARFDKKVARGLEARRGVTARLAAWARAHREPSRPLLWVHASSVGEGLQAKPVLEAVRAEVPQWQLAYTFFSPSAERLARTLPVDIADYLPLDRPAEVSAALDALKPAALVFSKLDVWPELTLAAAQRGVRLGLISATVAPHSSRLRWPARGWAEPAYRALERIGAISAEDGRRLEQLGARPGAIEVTGDTRYDSVAERAERFDQTRDPFAKLAIVPAGTFTIVAGSTWPADEAVVLPAFADLLAQVPAARLILAPHEPNPDHLAGIMQRARAAGLPRCTPNGSCGITTRRPAPKRARQARGWCGKDAVRRSGRRGWYSGWWRTVKGSGGYCPATVPSNVTDLGTTSPNVSPVTSRSPRPLRTLMRRLVIRAPAPT